VLAVALGDAETIAEEDAIQVVVTGDQDEGYNPSNASAATRTDTPLRNVPESIQVIPQEVIEDHQATLLDDALRNATGVTLRASIDPFDPDFGELLGAISSRSNYTDR
jgi:iron complex outermembrane recepter protein